MNRPLLACTFFVVASAALGAQQATPSGDYQGTSNPPADDAIVTSTTPEAKPPAGKPMSAAPAQQQAAQQPNSVASPTSDPDAGPVQGAQPAPIAPSAPPSLAARTYSADPDGDIVQPRAPRPGELDEGTTIRVKLLDRLSTVDSEKGEEFRSQVSSDVLQSGQVLIPAGSEIDGKVVQVSSGSHLGGHGAMRLRPETVILPDGSRFRLHAETTGTPGSHTRVAGEGTIKPGSRVKRDGIEYGGAVGAGAITGAIVAGPAGALTGGLIGAGIITTHLLVSHPQATLEPGSTLLFTLTEPLMLSASNSTGN